MNFCGIVIVAVVICTTVEEWEEWLKYGLRHEWKSARWIVFGKNFVEHFNTHAITSMATLFIRSYSIQLSTYICLLHKQCFQPQKKKTWTRKQQSTDKSLIEYIAAKTTTVACMQRHNIVIFKYKVASSFVCYIAYCSCYVDAMWYDE